MSSDAILIAALADTLAMRQSCDAMENIRAWRPTVSQESHAGFRIHQERYW